jgi:hypothetical protein
LSVTPALRNGIPDSCKVIANGVGEIDGVHTVPIDEHRPAMTQACPDLGRARSHEIASLVVGWSRTQERHVSVQLLLPTPG